MWKTRSGQHHSIEMEVLGDSTSLTLPLFIEGHCTCANAVESVTMNMCMRDINLASVV